MLSSDEKKALQIGLQLRDQLGGHHFLQAELGAGADGIQKLGWVCRDCGLRVKIDPVVWNNWRQLYLAVPDAVRAILGRRACVAQETDTL